MKEIEMLLMSTENELRGQPSLPVSHTRICVWIQEGETCDSTIYVFFGVFDPGFKDSGWTCVFCVCMRRRKHLGGLFLQKVMQ